MRRKDSVSSLKKKAWKVFSKYIRRGGGNCVTCGEWKPENELQASHFISRRFQATLFDERNVHKACVKCNIFLHGNLIEYYKFMLKKYGQETIDELIQESKKLKKWSKEELEEIIRKYM